METIAIQVDTDTAQAYQTASPEQIRALRMLMRLWSKGVTGRPKRTLDELMDDIADQAATNNLTPEVLQSILDNNSPYQKWR